MFKVKNAARLGSFILGRKHQPVLTSTSAYATSRLTQWTVRMKLLVRASKMLRVATT